jgi:glycosyltransferase involved in cell wall biosynthesis
VPTPDHPFIATEGLVVILSRLPAPVNRRLIRGATTILIHLSWLPGSNRARRLLTRRLVGDAKAGGTSRRRAVAAAERIAARAQPEGGVLLAEVLAAAGKTEVAVERLSAVAERFPGWGAGRFVLARLYRSTGDLTAADRQIQAAAASSDVSGVDLEEALGIAIAARSVEAVDALERRIPTWPTVVPNALRERVRGAAVIARSVAGGSSDAEAVSDILSTAPRMGSLALSWLLNSGDIDELRAIAQRVDLAFVDAWTARHAAVALRRAGDLSVSTKLAQHTVSVRPGDATAQRLVDVGHSSLAVLASGLPLEPVRRRSARGRDGTVAYLLHNSLPHASAGYATRTHGLLTALVRDGWDAHAITRLGYPYDVWGMDDHRTAAPLDRIDGVAYHRLLDGRRPYLKWPIGEYLDTYVSRVEKLVRQHDLGIVHGASNYWNGFAAVSAARRLGLPSVYEVRGLWELTRISRDTSYEGSEMFRLTARLEAAACRAADHVLTITDALRSEMVGRGVPGHKISVLPNGVDTSRFVPRDRDGGLAAELGVGDSVVIGYVGSVLDYEGIDLLLEAVARLRARREDFHLLVVGDGAAYDECVSKRNRLGLQDVSTFTGRVPHDEVERYYSLVDVAPFPRRPLPVCEAVSPLKPFEAMAMGKVPVVSSVAALTEIVEHDENGLVFTKGDAGSLVEVLDRVVGDVELRARLGIAARDWVVRERDWSVLVKYLENVYATIAADASPAGNRPA